MSLGDSMWLLIPDQVREEALLVRQADLSEGPPSEGHHLSLLSPT